MGEPDTLITVMSFAAFAVWWGGCGRGRVGPARWVACGVLLVPIALTKGMCANSISTAASDCAPGYSLSGRRSSSRQGRGTCRSGIALACFAWIPETRRRLGLEGPLPIALFCYAAGCTTMLLFWPGARPRNAMPIVPVVAVAAALVVDRARAAHPARFRVFVSVVALILVGRLAFVLVGLTGEVSALRLESLGRRSDQPTPRIVARTRVRDSWRVRRSGPVLRRPTDP